MIMCNQIDKKPIKHPFKPGLWLYQEKVLFPIWILNDQDYCEYKIYLQLEKGIKSNTKEKVEGKQIHNQLFSDFSKIAIPSSIEEIVKLSKIKTQISREVRLRSPKYGIIGKVDEIHFCPDKFIVIDDKPGPKKWPVGKNEPWEADKNQVYGYCLVLKEKMIEEFQDTRPIIASLRKRGTDNIYWNEIFDDKSEKKIIQIIDHIHRLISLEEEYKSNDEPGKCKRCSLNKECDRNISII